MPRYHFWYSPNPTAADGLASVALAAISPDLQPGSSFWFQGFPGFPAGISEAELAERAAEQPVTRAVQDPQVAGGPATGQEGGGGRLFARTSDAVFFPPRPTSEPSRTASGVR